VKLKVMEKEEIIRLCLKNKIHTLEALGKHFNCSKQNVGSILKKKCISVGFLKDIKNYLEFLCFRENVNSFEPEGHLWEVVEGFKNLEVSSLGFIRRIKSKKFGSTSVLYYTKVSGEINSCYLGYPRIFAKNNEGKSKTVSVHRVVAETFIPNPEGSRCVNHLDGNKHNNEVGNLEWCTYSENTRHSIDYLGNHSSKGGYSIRYPSGEMYLTDNLNSWSRSKNFNPSCVHQSVMQNTGYKGYVILKNN